MKALVIGGTGPTGPLVVEGLLERGYRVTILHSGKHEVELPGSVEHLHGQVNFIEPMKEVIGPRTFDLVIAMYGRLRYVAEVFKGKTSRFIAIGGAPYKAFVEGLKNPDGVPINISEDAPLFRDKKKNKFTYLITISEDTVMTAHKEGFYNATILRFPMIYGPRQVAPREWSIVRRILDGRGHIIIPDGGLRLERRGYSQNVAHAVLLAVDKPKESAGEIYNVGDETVLSVRDWVETIARALDHEFEFVSMPFSIARPSRPYAGRDFHWVAGIEKIKTELGYREIVPSGEGFKKTVKYYLENRPDPGGVLERNLGDPFDYATEDKFIRDYKEMEIRIREIDWVRYRFDHAYNHPKREKESQSSGKNSNI
ncbi:NAD-dependent epimerase/dehydratase family protein [Thermodesulfobacteriota bacterium]